MGSYSGAIELIADMFTEKLKGPLDGPFSFSDINKLLKLY